MQYGFTKIKYFESGDRNGGAPGAHWSAWERMAGPGGKGWGRAGGRQDGPVSDVAVGCAASRVLKTEDFVQVSAKRDPAGRWGHP